MKKILVSVFVTLLVMTTAYSASLLSIVDAAKTVNSNYKLYELSMEKTQLDYDKAMIEATNKKAELSAKSSKASGDNSTQNNLSSFYSEILNDIFDIKSKEITCQTNELTVKIAVLLSREIKTVTQPKSEPVKQKKLRAKRSQPLLGFHHSVTVAIHVNQKGLMG